MLSSDTDLGDPFRILSFSDYRTQDINKFLDYIRNLDYKPDVIIYAGDDVRRFYADGTNLFEEIGKFSRHGVLAVVGNDDTLDVKRIISGSHVRDIHEAPFVVGNFAFIGQEGAVGDIGYVLYREDEIKQHLRKQLMTIRRKKIVLVSHVPPYDCLDFAKRFGAEHIGSKAVRGIIEENKAIKLTICGHVHIYGGKTEKINHSLVLNIASHDDSDSPSLIGLISFYPSISEPLVRITTIENQVLMSLHFVGSKRCYSLTNAGYDSLQKIASSTPKDIAMKTSIPLGFIKHIYLSAVARIEGKIFRIKEFSFPDHPVYLDVETTPFECFMTGVYAPETDEFRQFVVEDIENSEEKAKVKKEIERFLRDHGKSIVSFTQYDRQFIPSSILKKKIYYDLHNQIKRSFVVNCSNYKLQSISKVFLSERQDDGLTGWDMPRLYSDYLRTKNEKFLEKVKSHNKDDVMDMHRIVESIRSARIKFSDEYFDW